MAGLVSLLDEFSKDSGSRVGMRNDEGDWRVGGLGSVIGWEETRWSLEVERGRGGMSVDWLVGDDELASESWMIARDKIGAAYRRLPVRLCLAPQLGGGPHAACSAT